MKKNQHASSNVYFWVWSDFWTPFDFDLVAVENSEWNFLYKSISCLKITWTYVYPYLEQQQTKIQNEVLVSYFRGTKKMLNWNKMLKLMMQWCVLMILIKRHLKYVKMYQKRTPWWRLLVTTFQIGRFTNYILAVDVIICNKICLRKMYV